MVKEVLVKDMINAGQKLLDIFEVEKLHPKAALWSYSSERNDWQYIVALPMYDLYGPLKTYVTIRTMFEKHSQLLEQIPLNMITAVSTSDRLILSLRKYYRSGKDRKIYRIKDSNIEGEFIEDAYIFKMI